MPKIHILTAIFLGTLVYVLLSFFGGSNGLWAERQLESQIQSISMRTAEITELNKKLELEYLGLRDSPEVIAAWAKKLGYVAEGERLIKISGLPEKTQTAYSTGTALRHQEISYIPEWVCKVAGFCVSALILLAVLLSKIKDALSLRSAMAR